MIKLLFLTLLYLGCTAAPIYAADYEFKNDRVEAQLRLSDSQAIDVVITTSAPPPDYPYSRKLSWGADENNPPQRIITSIHFIHNGTNVFIPLSAYSDLGNPRSVSLQSTETAGFQLTIKGGDAAGSYAAVYKFKNDDLESRKLISGEFPKDVWERTVYSFNHITD